METVDEDAVFGSVPFFSKQLIVGGKGRDNDALTVWDSSELTTPTNSFTVALLLVGTESE